MKKLGQYKHRHESFRSTIVSALKRKRWLVLLPLFAFVTIGAISLTNQDAFAGTADACERNPSTCGTAPAPPHPTVSAPKKAVYWSFINCVEAYTHMAMVDYDYSPAAAIDGEQGRIDIGNMNANKWWLDADDVGRAAFASPWGTLRDLVGTALNNAVSGDPALVINLPVKAIMAGSYFIDATPSDYGNTKCNDILKAVISVLGYSSAQQILIDAGVPRYNDSLSDATGSENWGEVNTYGDEISSVVKQKVYRGQANYTSEERYVLYREAWLKGCTNSGTAIVAPSGTLDKFKYPNLKYMTDDSEGEFTAKTYAGVENTKFRMVYTNDDRKTVFVSCTRIGEKMNEYAGAYSTWLQANLDVPGLEELCQTDPSAEGCQEILTGNEPTCGSAVGALGWLLCPVINALGSFNDGMWAITSSLLVVPPLQQGDVAYTIWQSFRNLANVLLAAVFLIVIFSQLTGMGVSNYGIKKALPRLAIIAVAINLSFIIIQLAVDVANIAGDNIYNYLSALAAGASSTVTWTTLITQLASVAVAGAVGTLGVFLAGGPAAAFYLVLPAAALAALGFIAALATLIFRQAIIPILAILAPVAFVAYLLPNTEKWFKKWRDLFTSMLILYITAALLFGGVKLASNMILGTNPDLWQTMIALVMLGIPLFSLPFIARQGGPLMSGMMKGAQSGIQKLRKPLEGFANPRAQRAANNWANGAAGSKNRLQRLYGRRRMAKRNVELDSQAAEEEFNNQHAGTAAGQARIDRLNRAKVQTTIDNDDALKRLEGNVELSLKAKLSKTSLDGAKQKTEQLFQELGTESDASHLNSVNPGLRTQIQSAQQTLDVAKDATASAERRQRGEYADALKASAGVVGGLAQQAGGVGKNGESIAVARAIEQEKRTASENVSAEGVLLTTQQYSTDEYRAILGGEVDPATGAVAAPVLRGGVAASAEQQEAALAAIHASGSVGAKIKAGAQLAAMAAANPGDANVVSLQQSFEKMGGLPQYYSGQRRDELRQGTMTMTVPELILETSQSGKVSPQVVGKMDVDEMKEFVAAFSDPAILGQMSWEQRNNVATAIDDARSDDVIGKMFGPREIEQLNAIQGLLR